MRIVALVDAAWSGHHPSYLKVFAKVLLELGYRVVVLCPKPIEMMEWIEANCQSLSVNFQAFQFCGSTTAPSRLERYLPVLKFWKDTAQAIKSVFSEIGEQPSFVFFPWLDSYALGYLPHFVVDKIFPYAWSGLLFQPSAFLRRPKYRAIHAYLFCQSILRAKTCKAIALLNEDFTSELQRCFPKKKVILFPDFSDESSPDWHNPLIQKIRDQATGRKIVGLLGSLNKRKGLLELLEISALMKNQFFVFVGHLSEQGFSPQELEKVWTIIDSQPENCFFYLERVPTEAVFNAVIQTCDVLFAVYQNFPHSSNMLTKSALFEKPILVSREHCMGDRVQRFNLGITVEEGNLNQYIEGIRHLSDDSRHTQTAFNFEDYKHFHSVQTLSLMLQSLCDYIAESC